MKNLFKLTKFKTLVTILFFLLSSFFLYLFISSTTLLPNICLPTLPDISGNPIPTPTPPPFSITQTVTDLKNPYCLGNDPSAQLASSILHTTTIVIIVLPFALLAYLLACIVGFFIAKFKNQKKYPAKLKK